MKGLYEYESIYVAKSEKPGATQFFSAYAFNNTPFK